MGNIFKLHIVVWHVVSVWGKKTIIKKQNDYKKVFREEGEKVGKQKFEKGNTGKESLVSQKLKMVHKYSGK